MQNSICAGGIPARPIQDSSPADVHLVAEIRARIVQRFNVPFDQLEPVVAAVVGYALAVKADRR